MTNSLRVGTRRTGNLVDFDPSTPRVQVTLERTIDRIQLHVPWSNDDDPYARWFLDSRHAVPMQPTSVPTQLLFTDDRGAILLVGCHKAGYRSTLWGAGTGLVSAQYALLTTSGTHTDFERVHGLASEVSGFRAWLGISTITSDIPRTEEERASYDFFVRVKLAPSLEVMPERALTFDSLWDHDPAELEDGVIINDRLYLRSRSRDPVPWTELMKSHVALRDLMILSRWVRVSHTVRSVTREEDGFRAAEGLSGPRWREVIDSSEEVLSTPSINERRHLIEYADIGLPGILQWLEMSEEFARALDPIISTRLMDGVSPMALLSQTGPGIEALGYLLMLKDGLTREQAKRKTFAERLERILVNVGSVLPFDAENFPAWAAATYNGLKHANRTLPSELDTLNVWQRLVLVARAWVAIELGVQPALAKSRLSSDPQAHNWR